MTGDLLHEHVIEQYTQYVNPSLARLMSFAGFGVEMRAEGCYIYDQEDRAFLDFLGGYGVFSLGHRHPKVIEAVQYQLGKMPLSGKVMFNPVAAELAERLAKLAPGDLQYTFFSNSGAEAVEAALKFARLATGRKNFVATLGGYHGKTLGALSVTGREKYRKPVEPLSPGATFVPFGDTESIVRAIDDQTAGVIIEIIQGEGGIHVAPEGYMAAIQKRCREVGALLIVDEVQTGLGRTGSMFASTAEGIEPDIMTLAKALGGGILPIGATMSTPQVWEQVFATNPLMHTSTFGGNPLACAAAIAALEVIQQEHLCERSAELGKYMLQRLRAEVRSPLVSEIRGRGLMIGIEFTMDEVGELVIGQMTKRGMIAAYTLNNPKVIRIEPPLVVNQAQIDLAIHIFNESLEETEAVLEALV